MTSSSPALSSSSSSSTSGTQLLSSSSSPLPPRLSLQSPELQSEFLRECQSRLQFHVGESSETLSPSPFTPTSPLPSPFSPAPTSSPGSSSSSSSSSPCFDNRRARLSLSSPELLSELKHSRTRSLRHVPAHNGLTTVFSGRGRGRGGGGQVSRHKQVIEVKTKTSRKPPLLKN
ncbi:uncharacterized protein LKV04_022001 [Tautogolabrus adspersus]